MGLLDTVRRALMGAVASPPVPASPVPAAEHVSTAPEAPDVATTTYTVRTGDTLGDIGARHGVARDDLARLNGIDEPDLIFPGQEIRVPTR